LVPLEYGFTEDVLTQLRAHWNKMAPNELQVLRAGALNSSQVDNQAQPDEPTQNTEDSAPSPADESSTGTGPPPVTLVANVDGVTIMSDDTEAVFKLERLLRAMSRQTFAARVDFSVFNLKHSSASRVSKLLSEIYATSNRLPFSDRVRVTADDRLNSIVVFGSRSKRREVGALLQALDSKQFADLTVPGPPVMIQLQYASAEQVEEKLQALYKTQLSVVGGRPPIEIPPGADPQVVATLQQINAAREGPLLSLEVDQASNSLLVVGTDPLVQEIRTFAEQLDHETAQSRVGIRVVPLETLRGEEVVKSLQKLFNK
jgi:type II secretory pathway component GspD/PulD (secretin)